MSVDFLKLLIFSIIGFLFFASILLYGVIILSYRKEKMGDDNKLDEFTTNYYKEELDKIISYKTVYYIDSSIGKRFSITDSMNADLSNDEILEAHEAILKDIFESISLNMSNYLSKSMGKKWLNDYIRIQTLSLVLNYSKITIEKLTLNRFNK